MFTTENTESTESFSSLLCALCVLCGEPEPLNRTLIPQEMARSQPDEPGDFHGSIRLKLQIPDCSAIKVRPDKQHQVWSLESDFCSQSDLSSMNGSIRRTLQTGSAYGSARRDTSSSHRPRPTPGCAAARCEPLPPAAHRLVLADAKPAPRTGQALWRRVGDPSRADHQTGS